MPADPDPPRTPTAMHLHPLRALLTAALLTAACSSASTPTVTTLPAALTSAPPHAAGAPTLAPATSSPGSDRCFPDGPGPEEFVAAGVVGTAGGPGGDARRVSEIRIDSARGDAGDDPACERLAVDLATADGAPATGVGIVEVELLARPAVLRLSLGSLVAETAVADVLLEGALIRRAFVIRDETRLTIDVHLGAQVAAAVVPARGRVVVDLRRTGDLPAGAAVASGGGALLEPGAVASYPLLISGYGRSPAGELTVTVTGRDGQVAETVAVPDYPWGWFEVVVVSGPEGTVEVAAGGAVQTVLIG